MFSLVMTSDAKSSDDAANYGRSMSARARTFMALARYRAGSGIAQALRDPSYSFSQSAQAIERSAGVLRKFMVGVVNAISVGGKLDSSKRAVQELMNVIEFSGMTAVGVVREMVLTIHPDLLCHPALRLEAFIQYYTIIHTFSSLCKVR